MKRYKKIEILDESPKVTNAEAESFMDFDTLVEQHHTVVRIGSGAKWGLALLTLTSIGLITYFTGILDMEDQNTKVATSFESEERVNEPVLPADTSAINEEVTKRSKKESAIEPNTEHQIHESIQDTESIEVLNKKTTNETNDKKAETITEENVPTPYVYQEAEPVEGLAYLYAYFHENLSYPDELRKDSIEGAVIVKFTILKDSTVANITVVQSLGEQFDKEAIRVVESMPKWKPANVNGTPVSSNLSIPLTFHIER